MPSTVAKLRRAEVLTTQGRSVAEAVRAIGVTEPTRHRWRAEFGGPNKAVSNLALKRVIPKGAEHCPAPLRKW